MSLFERDDVAPPEPCSRCGVPVPRTSLFCPKCGQSRVNPLPKVQVEEPAAEEAPASADDAPEQAEESEEKRSTLSRTTDWIIKSIARVGQGGQPDQELEEPQSEEAPADRAGGPTSTWPSRLQDSPRVKTRFVLVAADGRQFTLGEALTGVGSADAAPDDEPMQWISITAEDNSIDPIHLRCGVEDGLFWIEDANSIMGTIISEPGRAPLQCIPFERYFLVRGSELQLGSLALTLQ